MQRIIDVTVENKIAKNPNAQYICGNSDYEIHFHLDDEWDSFYVKTARFKWNRDHIDVVFSGTVCAVPKITSTKLFSVGLFAGDISTTTPAYVKCIKSILCGDSIPADPTPDVYTQIMELLNKGVDENYIKAALARAKESGEFDGAPGQDGYTPQKGVDYFDGEPGPVGPQGEPGTPGKDGQNYNLTDTDKQEIANMIPGEPGLFVAQYGVTTVDEVLAAAKSGRVCVVRIWNQYLYLYQYNDDVMRMARFWIEEGNSGEVTLAFVDEDGWSQRNYKSYNEYHRSFTINENSTDDTIPTSKTVYNAIPKNISKLTNDSGFVTRLVGDLANYYTKQQTYTQDEIKSLVSAIPKFAISVVDALPSANINASTVYLLKAGNASGDLYTEYIFTNGAWEVLGSQKVDLTGYATEQWVNKTIADFLTKDKIVDVLGFTPVGGERVEQLDKAIAEQRERTVPTYTLAEGETPEDAPEWAEEVIDPYNDPEGGGGSTGGADIDVTAAVGQTIVVKETDENGKPTKWESADYQPRTHWVEQLSEPVWKEIYTPRTIVPGESDELLFLAMSDIGLTAGREYRVMWNGTAYTVTAERIVEQGDDAIELVAIGDLGAMVGEPSGDIPFVIATAPMDGVVVTAAIPIDGSTVVSVGIEEKQKEMLHKLPNEYLDLEWIPKVEKVLLLPAMECAGGWQRIDIADKESALYKYILRQGDGCKLTIRMSTRSDENGLVEPIIEEDIMLTQLGDQLDCEYTACFGGGRSRFTAEIVFGMVYVTICGDGPLNIEIYGYECNDVPIGSVSSLKYLQAFFRSQGPDASAYVDDVLSIGSVYEEGTRRYVTSLNRRYVREIPDDIEDYAEMYYDHRDLPNFHSMMMVYKKLKSELDTALGSYITDIDALIGGEE